MEVVIYSKPGCHLCDIVKAQLERLRESMAFELRDVDCYDQSVGPARQAGVGWGVLSGTSCPTP